ncbi:hypothetical protein LTR62_008122 [Meristemomyces frigidus]|uniref:Uracil-DNA glycosylase n=1 Tax=Meristemomyces frigidus TaxID=1508187 RepID=A0AAN7TB39_9PEZI|nr:hypothetical protein LTR62_008122 [Meristemomyces frigidus]
MSLKRKAVDLAADAAKKPKAEKAITSFFGQPKPSGVSKSCTSPATDTKATPFDKAAWLSKLSCEQKDLLKLEIDTLDESWLGALKDEVTTKDFLDLKRFLKREQESGKKVFPPPEDIYSWSRHTPLHNVKAVILGQDPYHNVNQAHGLCFSVRPPTPAPPSLKNIYTAIKRDYPAFTAPPKQGGDLTAWADRGVLLLNTCLTVRAHEANSHSKKGWERFTQKVIDTVASKRSGGVVFLAWGKPAQERCKGINASKHLVLKSVHPSPLSAARGWFECGHFGKANEWLVGRYGEGGGIDWDLSPKAEGTGKVEGVIIEGAKVENVKVEEGKVKEVAVEGVEVADVEKADHDGGQVEGGKVDGVDVAELEGEFDDDEDVKAELEKATPDADHSDSGNVAGAKEDDVEAGAAKSAAESDSAEA